jgi:ubiquinone/menaquinone biosynthesis C-methylase UbiE
MTTLSRALSLEGSIFRALPKFSLAETIRNFGIEEVPPYYDPEAIRDEFEGVARELNFFGAQFRLYDLLMGWWERKSDRDLLDFMNGSPPAASMTLLGVGTGYLLQLLAARYPAVRIRGSDLSLNMLEVAQDKLLSRGHSRDEVDVIPRHSGSGTCEHYREGRILLVQEDCRRVDVPDASQDVVVTAYFLDLLSPDQIRQSLREVERLLKPGGRAHLMSLTSGIDNGCTFRGKAAALYFRMRNGFYALWYHSKLLRELSHALFDGYYTHCRPIGLSRYVGERASLSQTRSRISCIRICGIPYLPVKMIEVIRK